MMLELSGKTPNDRKKKLEAFLSENRRALLVYGATWCGPCRAYEGSIRELERKSIAPVLHIDVDACEELCESVSSVPTTALYFNGEPVSEVSGSLSAAELIKWVAKHLESRGLE